MSLPKALVVGIHHWQSPLRVGTHYIIQYLLDRGFQVAYLSAPITTLHQLLPDTDDLQRRRVNNTAGGQREMGGQLWHYVPYALLAPDNRPILSTSLVLNYWQFLSAPNVIETVKRAGFADVDVLFLDSIYQPFWLSAINYKFSAYRLADNTSGFTGYSRSAKSVEERIFNQVDMVFAASYGLKTYASLNGAKNIKHLANGIDLERFANLDGIADLDLPKLTGPVAAYIGAFSYWFDHNTVFQLAYQRPDISILLIGPMESVLPEYENLPNVHLVGAVPAEQIPAYLSLADIGLMPFNVKEYPRLLNDVNPLKLYEYMAAGLPVVSYRWRELEQLNSPAKLVDSNEEFVRAVSAILEHGSSGESERLFASQHDWNHKLKPLGDWINQNVP
jgi:glycosyltransferase involved in cell wall biosynthesis